MFGLRSQLFGVAGIQFGILVPGVTFLVLFGRGLTHVIVAAFKGFVCMVLINGLSHWRLVVGYALQVFPVVTRLTVYRRLQVQQAL